MTLWTLTALFPASALPKTSYLLEGISKEPYIQQTLFLQFNYSDIDEDPEEKSYDLVELTPPFSKPKLHFTLKENSQQNKTLICDAHAKHCVTYQTASYDWLAMLTPDSKIKRPRKLYLPLLMDEPDWVLKISQRLYHSYYMYTIQGVNGEIKVMTDNCFNQIISITYRSLSNEQRVIKILPGSWTEYLKSQLSWICRVETDG